MSLCVSIVHLFSFLSSFHYVNIPNLFTHPPTNDYSGCLQLLAIANKAAMNIHRFFKEHSCAYIKRENASEMNWLIFLNVFLFRFQLFESLFDS